MHAVTKISAALLLASAVAFSGSALAQTGTRDASIARCVKVAQAQHPGDAEDVQLQRTAAYKACMTAAGHAP
ncbi:MAG: hypothetical protein Q7T81_07920 [Pseudolabrys sp.]|nr:hypothetical protein [Pseudolabrys sp.]